MPMNLQMHFSIQLDTLKAMFLSKSTTTKSDALVIVRSLMLVCIKDGGWQPHEI
jgi:hypothetical protein